MLPGARRPLLVLASLLAGALPAGAQAPAGAAIPVAARDLPRGATLTEADIAFRPATASDRPAAAPATPGAGWVTRRVIRAGEPLREPGVGKPVLVRSGQPVQVVWRGKGIALRIRGVAARSASLGERVPVRIDTGWRVEGAVAGEALVHIDPPLEDRG